MAAPTKHTVPKVAPSDLGIQSTGIVAVDLALMNAAEHYGVPPAVMFADAQQESGLNPKAVGDQGTSFGLFQEHEGGELTSVAFAENPVDAANLAASNFAGMRAQMPNATWGQIVAASQRPADQAGYASSVNAKLGKAGTLPAGQASKALGQNVSKPLQTPGAALPSGSGAVGPMGPVGSSGGVAGTNSTSPALQAFAELGGIVNSVSVPQTSSLYNQISSSFGSQDQSMPGQSQAAIARSIQESYPAQK